MQTPPGSSSGTRPNYMQFRRGDSQQDSQKNEMMMKFGPKYQIFRKENPTSQKEAMAKVMSDLRKYSDFLKDTKWMFENNECLHADNYSANPL